MFYIYVFKRFHNLQREKYKSECVLLFDTYDGESFSLTSFMVGVYLEVSLLYQNLGMPLFLF